MGKPELKLARDPSRNQLAAAIEVATKAEGAAETARNAVARATDMIAQARERLDAAFAETARAKGEASARALTAATTGEALAPDGSTRTARLRELDATDDLEASRAALPSAETAAHEAEYQLGQARKQVAAAAKAVLAGGIERVITDVDRLRREFHAKRAALLFLHDVCFEWPPSDESRRVKSHLFLGELVELTRDGPAGEPWRRAFEALQRDADAPLPS